LPKRILIAPEGEVDIARIAEFRAALSDAAGADAARLVVDLSQVSFIDSSGLGALVELHHRLARDRRQLAVVAPSGTVAAVLISLGGLRGRLEIFETRRAALEVDDRVSEPVRRTIDLAGVHSHFWPDLG
jgi:anti-sigma B factor antagonist